MHKVLFIATYGDFFTSFEIPNMLLLRNMGFEIHCAANFKSKVYNKCTYIIDRLEIIRHHIEFERMPNRKSILNSYKSLVRLMTVNHYSLLDCHNPIVSAIGRIAARKCKINQVLYTVHGFFFYKGCPLIYKLVYKPIEYFMSYYTDAIITINFEDYEASKKMKIRGQTFYVPGIGIDIDNINTITVNNINKRKQLGIPEKAILCLSVGELNKGKNHKVVIDALYKLKNTNIYYIICGQGVLEQSLNDLIVNYKIEKNIKLLGYRTDIIELCKISDIFILPSFREGLPVALMEAMASHCAVIASRIRGNTDLIIENKGGLLFDPKSSEELSNAINYLGNHYNLRHKYADFNSIKIKEFNVSIVIDKMKSIYYSLLKNNT